MLHENQNFNPKYKKNEYNIYLYVVLIQLSEMIFFQRSPASFSKTSISS